MNHLPHWWQNGVIYQIYPKSFQDTTGCDNDLRLRIYGDKGGLIWRQENPNQLFYTPIDMPAQCLTRGGPGLCEAAMQATRLPAGHPEGFIEAFANVYLGVGAAIRGRGNTHRTRGVQSMDGQYPTLTDGARGVRFIEKVVESAQSDVKWTRF